ncbi:pseudaminic acid synthase [Pelagibacterales bacterium SAG-MED38]|nr:pseudaminic acid synthase [Pelagibacterales bacterium SAG-MED38]
MNKLLLPKKKPLLIGEVSCNHNGKILNAKKIIDVAKKYGVDFIKLQTYSASSLTIKTDRKDFLIQKGLWKGKKLWDLYDKAKTPFSWQKDLFEYTKKKKIKCFSTPFDEKAVDLLEKLSCPIYKIASFEINHFPLIKKIAQTKKPMIISTGMAHLKNIDLAVNFAKKNGCKQIIILYCVSNYPSNIEDFNFKNIEIIKKRYNCKVGFSDHSIDNRVASAAVLAGADYVEKHIALDNQKKSFDIKFSLKGKEIKKFRDDIDTAWKLRGKNYFFRNKSEKVNNIFKRSIYVTSKIKKGEKFSENNVSVIRPGFSLDPIYYYKLLKKKAKKNYKIGERIFYKQVF